MQSITGNKIYINDWYTIYDLRDNYDLIISKNWMTVNSHTIDNVTNMLNMLRDVVLSLENSSLQLTTTKSIMIL
jgi:hypothetical protein